MRKRISLVILLAASVTAMSGCPTVPENRAAMEQLMVLPGDWVFIYYNLNGEPVRVAGIKLNEDNSTGRFVVEGEMLESTRAWWQTGAAFTLEQQFGDFPYWSQATVQSANQLSGEILNVRRNIVEGTFYAARVTP